MDEIAHDFCKPGDTDFDGVAFILLSHQGLDLLVKPLMILRLADLGDNIHERH